MHHSDDEKIASWPSKDSNSRIRNKMNCKTNYYLLNEPTFTPLEQQLNKRKCTYSMLTSGLMAGMPESRILCLLRCLKMSSLSLEVKLHCCCVARSISRHLYSTSLLEIDLINISNMLISTVRYLKKYPNFRGFVFKTKKKISI